MSDCHQAPSRKETGERIDQKSESDERNSDSTSPDIVELGKLTVL